MPSNYFLKIDGIPGESLDAKHKDEIEVLSWSWGESQPAPVSAGGGAGSGKVAMGDLQVNTQTSRGQSAAAAGLCVGQAPQERRAHRAQGGQGADEYLTFSLSDVLVSGYQTGGRRPRRRWTRSP